MGTRKVGEIAAVFAASGACRMSSPGPSRAANASSVFDGLFMHPDMKQSSCSGSHCSQALRRAQKMSLKACSLNSLPGPLHC